MTTYHQELFDNTSKRLEQKIDLKDITSPAQLQRRMAKYAKEQGKEHKPVTNKFAKAFVKGAKAAYKAALEILKKPALDSKRSQVLLTKRTKTISAIYNSKTNSVSLRARSNKTGRFVKYTRKEIASKLRGS